MKKVLLFAICFILILSLAGCGCTNTPAETETHEHSEETATGIIPNDVPAGSEADIAVRETVASYLDTFISCDFDAIKSIIHEDDQWYFNFESADQLAFYEAVFPQIEYEFEFVSEHEGVYGVMTQITSPNMAEVYGTVITDYIDSTVGHSDKPVSEIVAENTERMLSLIKSPTLPRRVEKLYIYVEYINGKYIPRCDVYLANEITGGAPEVSDEITNSISEAVGALSEE